MDSVKPTSISPLGKPILKHFKAYNDSYRRLFVYKFQVGESLFYIFIGKNVS